MSDMTLVSFLGSENSDYWVGARAVRWEVFVEEQGVPAAVEIDARDFLSSTVQLVGLVDGTVVATSRVLPDPDGTGLNFHLGRVAVFARCRGRGWGADIVRFAGEAIAARISRGRVGTITLDAQVQAIGFYESVGYLLTDRPEFLDVEIPHREMVLSVKGTA